MASPILSFLQRHAVVPALIMDDADKAAPLADALLEGGLPCAEVTLRSPNALKVLETMAANQDVVVGAGTVMNVAQATDALAAGARFIVSPGISEPLVRFCQEREVTIIPGAVTATEVMLAANLGLSCVKFFPCEASGGLPVLKALQGPFPTMNFMPTGGINGENLPRYLGFAPVLAVGGSWMVRPDWLKKGAFELVAEACRQTMAQVVRIRLQQLSTVPATPAAVG